MHLSQTLGAGVALAAAGWFLLQSGQVPPIQVPPVQVPPTQVLPAEASPTGSTPAPTTPIAANGHYTLVVEGNRNALAITTAVRKAEPWAGIPTGFTSKWQLQIHDAAGALLVAVPLDVTPFATEPQAFGRPATVEGCVVRDSRIGMLVNVPAYPTAHRYVFVRDDGQALPTVVSEVAASQVESSAGGGR
jgi:hypothetical protein